MIHIIPAHRYNSEDGTPRLFLHGVYLVEFKETGSLYIGSYVYDEDREYFKIGTPDVMPLKFPANYFNVLGAISSNDPTKPDNEDMQ